MVVIFLLQTQLSFICHFPCGCDRNFTEFFYSVLLYSVSSFWPIFSFIVGSNNLRLCESRVGRVQDQFRHQVGTRSRDLFVVTPPWPLQEPSNIWTCVLPLVPTTIFCFVFTHSWSTSMAEITFKSHLSCSSDPPLTSAGSYYNVAVPFFC